MITRVGLLSACVGMKIFLLVASRESLGAGRRRLPAWPSSSSLKIKLGGLHDAVWRLSWGFFFFCCCCFSLFFSKNAKQLWARVPAAGSRDPRVWPLHFLCQHLSPTSPHKMKAGQHRLGPAVAMVFAVAGHVPGVSRELAVAPCGAGGESPGAAI